MIIGRHKSLDIEKLKPVIEKIKSIDNTGYHKSLTHQQGAFDEIEFKKEYPEIFEYLEKNTYPENLPINRIWFKKYTSDTSLGTSSGEFIGLHQDRFYETPEDKESLIHTNSILLEISPDADGGYTVLAGDDIEDKDLKNRFKDTRDRMSRLIAENISTPGDTMVWNGWTLHGVSEMKSGKKLNLIVIKKSKFDEDYFKNG